MRTILALLGIALAGLLLLSGIAFVKSPQEDRSFGPLGWLAEMIADSGPDEAPGLPMPHNGAQKIYSTQRLGSDDPVFTIHNTKSPLHCFVKLEDARTGKVAGEFFVHPNNKVVTRMIDGKFRIKVAFGKTWYGREKLFGKKTEVFQYDNAVEFQAIPVGGASALSREGRLLHPAGVCFDRHERECEEVQGRDGPRLRVRDPARQMVTLVACF